MLKPKTKTKNAKQLMKNQILIGGTILMLAAMSAWGAENVSSDQGLQYDQGDSYRANELSLDAFGTASLGRYTIENWSASRARHNGQLGAGLGLNYFFIRNLGIGADVYSENTTRAFFDSASANLILRFPLGQSGFAPYAFGGGGRQFDMVKAWFAQVGGGIEYRFTRHVGAFVDARWVLPDEARYYGVARLGVRFAF
jgi:hypothetical protein